MKHYYLKPGEYCVSRFPSVISTVLGSCVSACLFDPMNGVAGMNHFLLSGETVSPESPLLHTNMGRYGVHAMELLINDLLKAGAERRRLQAKVFGGAKLLLLPEFEKSVLNVGELNGRFVKNFLERERIPLLACDIGGVQGRVIRFYTAESAVYVKKLNPMNNRKLSQQEKDFWRKSRQALQKRRNNVDLWLN